MLVPEVMNTCVPVVVNHGVPVGACVWVSQQELGSVHSSVNGGSIECSTHWVHSHILSARLECFHRFDINEKNLMIDTAHLLHAGLLSERAMGKRFVIEMMVHGKVTTPSAPHCL